MRIVVTGATGLLGSTLVPALAARGHEVVRLRRGKSAAALDVSADLTDAAEVARTLDQVAPDAIVNLAAMTNVDTCERDPTGAYESNTRPVENLAAWISNGHARTHLVQISTDQLYDGVGPHREEHVRPISYYSFSKLAGELAASRVGAAVLRTNLFGRSRAPDRKSLSDWVHGILTRRETARVFDDVLFNPLSLDSLAANIALVAERRVEGTFNLGSRGGMSKADFAFRLGATFGLNTDLLTRADSKSANFAARRPLDMRMDCGKYERQLAVVLPTLDTEIESMRQVYDHAT